MKLAAVLLLLVSINTRATTRECSQAINVILGHGLGSVAAYSDGTPFGVCEAWFQRDTPRTLDEACLYYISECN